MRDSVLLPVGSVISQTGQDEWDGEVVSEGLGRSSLRLSETTRGSKLWPGTLHGLPKLPLTFDVRGQSNRTYSGIYHPYALSHDPAQGSLKRFS